MLLQSHCIKRMKLHKYIIIYILSTKKYPYRDHIAFLFPHIEIYTIF